MEEVDANEVMGPFRHLNRIPFKSVRLLRRFGSTRGRAEGAESQEHR